MPKTNKASSMVSQINPAPGYLFIEPVASQKQTASGIYLPESHDEKPQEGMVVAVGADLVSSGTTTKSPAQKGDKVIYKKWGGNEVKVDEKEYLFVKFDDILAIVS